MKEEPILTIETKVSAVKGFGPKKAEALSKLGIYTLADVLEHYPRSYEDLRNAKLIGDLENEDKALVRARVLLVKPGRGYGRKRTLKLLVEDMSGRMEVVFFSAGFMMKTFTVGDEYRFFGKAKVENGKVTMFHPAYVKEDGTEEAGILPVYPLASGLTQKDLRRLSKLAVELMPDTETLPESVVRAANVCSSKYALSNLHYPAGEKEYSESRYRLVYEELFDLRTAILLSRSRGGSGAAGIAFEGDGGEEFIRTLKYTLTAAQRRTADEVLADMRSAKAMNRLVQGDVGSGKTAVAEIAIAQAVKCGFQAAFMAPTEILAGQHFESLSADFEPLGLNVELITGSMSAAERKAALKRVEDGEANVIVGTHALISGGLNYNNLGLVITDEQHRFGVSQRELLAKKGENPDILVMTATPIPRTLAVVFYGDLDISVIDELPPGRRSIITDQFSEDTRKNAYELLISEVKQGRQAYIVAPFIDDSDSIEGYSAEGLFEDFTKKHPDITAALLHSGVRAADKDAVMEDFYNGKISVLISTVVIEVGINVPNASVMLIENCERFGLAQLHQLRGRVGRGTSQSYCLLVMGEESDIAKERCETMCTCSDGFKIAEKDLEMRGPGEIFGYRQHGLPQLKLADPAKHLKISEKAGADAAKLLEDDPDLSRTENAAFAERLRTKYLKADHLTL